MADKAIERRPNVRDLHVLLDVFGFALGNSKRLSLLCKQFIGLAVLFWSWTSFSSSVSVDWEAETDDIEFDHVLIHRVLGNTYDPVITVNGEERYVGYYGSDTPPGHYLYGSYKINDQNDPHYASGFLKIDDADGLNGNNYYFLMELLGADDTVLAYSDYYQYEYLAAMTGNLMWSVKDFSVAPAMMPEPSSGLLLLMGGALLGLRRKRRVA